MRRTLYIHIGNHRTATTSIQQFMFQNFQPLLQAGYFYPLQVPRHLRLMNTIFSGEESADSVARSLNRRADDRDAQIHTLVLSDEDISTREDLSLLLAFRDHFDVRIVYSMRRQDLWLESWFFQNVKWQRDPFLSHCSFDELLSMREQFHWIRYNGFVQHLEELFGAENLRLSVFEKGQMPNGPVRTFCDQIGLGSIEGLVEPAHTNASMSAQMAEFARHLPLDQFKPPQRRRLCQVLETIDRDVLGNVGRQSERLIPPMQRAEILAEYEPGNRAVAQRYFGREELFFDPLPAEDAALARLELPSDSITLMERFVVPLLEQLAEDDAISPAKGTS